MFSHLKTCAGPAGEERTTLGVSHMDSLVQELLDQCIAKATHAVYNSAWSSFVATSTPLSEHTLCQFTALLSQSVSWRIVQFSTIAFYQPMLVYMLKAPTSNYILRKLHEVLSKHPVSVDNIMLLSWLPPGRGVYLLKHARLLQQL